MTAVTQRSRNPMLNKAWVDFKAGQKADGKAKPEPNVDRGPNRRARNPAAPASNGPKVENGLGTPQGVGPFQEGAPRSRGAHRQVGMPDQHQLRAKPAKKPAAKKAPAKKGGRK